MPTPVTRQTVGPAVSITGANAIASAAYAVAADALRLVTSSGPNAGALLADFRLTRASGAMFGAAPTAGTVQLIAVPRAFDGTPGPAPSASMLGRVVGTFSPSPATGNAATGWVMSIDSVPLPPDCDFFLFNNATGQSLSAGWTLTAQPWSPGT